MEEGLSLGLMIRGGAEYGLGIYITGVDPGSAADAGALKVTELSPNPHYLRILPFLTSRLSEQFLNKTKLKTSGTGAEVMS